MKIKKIHSLFVLYFVISLACNALSGPLASESPQDEIATKVPPPVASGNGPQGFSAEATSSDSVLLSWQPVDGATTYHVAVSTNDGETLTVIDLPSTVTSYEDFLVSPDSQLIYAVEALGETQFSVEYSLIRAPFDGVVLTKLDGVGEVVAP
ncbi:MAG: fibronectin type III domain-containing protein, partial [Nitrospirae bacterium]|nr:fibronectin type III domain-containing protein [Nitrospirota bacterium]